MEIVTLGEVGIAQVELASILPPIPASDAAHPIVVHFPIALLLVTPVFLSLGLFWRSKRAEMLLVAMVISVIGTAFAFLATSTGEAAERYAELVPEAAVVVHEHAELAELARNLFIGVTIVYGLGLVAPWKWRASKWTIAAPVVGLAAFVGPAIVLANAGHEGGRLVHEFGVHAPVGGASSVLPPLPNGSTTNEACKNRSAANSRELICESDEQRREKQ